MPLAPGTRIGPYEVTSAIGAGGMGESTGRAIREAAAGRGDQDPAGCVRRGSGSPRALNHPNIAQVFGVTEDPPALIMEFVDGEDLAGWPYSSTGSPVLSPLTGGGVWAVPFDDKALRITGEPFVALESARAPRVSADARTLVMPAVASVEAPQAALVSTDGAMVRRVGPIQLLEMFGPPALAPDGRHI